MLECVVDPKNLRVENIISSIWKPRDSNIEGTHNNDKKNVCEILHMLTSQRLWSSPNLQRLCHPFKVWRKLLCNPKRGCAPCKRCCHRPWSGNDARSVVVNWARSTSDFELADGEVCLIELGGVLMWNMAYTLQPTSFSLLHSLPMLSIHLNLVPKCGTRACSSTFVLCSTQGAPARLHDNGGLKGESLSRPWGKSMRFFLMHSVVTLGRACHVCSEFRV